MPDSPAPVRPAAPPIDPALVARAARGDQAAFAQLVEAVQPRALRFAARMLGETARDTADDVTQDAWVRAWRALPRYDARHPFEVWFFTILANRCRTALRRRTLERRWTSPLDDHDVPEIGVDPTGRLDAAAATALLERALASLPVEQREAFLLRHVEQLGYDEIAAATGAGVSACKMRVKRATDALRARLGDGGTR
jgi:RNA polymerase sigma-70 factor (ECF subfamily)